MLFFDRNLGRSIPDALALLRVPAEKHLSHFAHDAPDEDWLPEVGKRGWVVVTRDNLLRNQMALAAIVDHSVGCFLLPGVASRPRWYAMRIIARHWDQIERMMETAERPFVCKLYLQHPPKQVDLSAIIGPPDATGGPGVDPSGSSRAVE